MCCNVCPMKLLVIGSRFAINGYMLDIDERTIPLVVVVNFSSEIVVKIRREVQNILNANWYENLHFHEEGGESDCHPKEGAMIARCS
jgi:hypothetical protein